MELPLETESYVHRIGRTARAGESGAAISFVTADERGQLKAVERFIKKTIPVDRDQPFHSAPSDHGGGKGRPGGGRFGKGGGADIQGEAAHEPWVHPANRNRTNRKRQKHKSFLGRRQPDFGQK